MHRTAARKGLLRPLPPMDLPFLVLVLTLVGFGLVMLASAEDYAPQTQPARDGAYMIEGACSHTEVAPYLEQYVKPEAARWHTLDDIAKTLDGCIAKLAEADQTVNTKYFRELVM